MDNPAHGEEDSGENQRTIGYDDAYVEEDSPLIRSGELLRRGRRPWAPERVLVELFDISLAASHAYMGAGRGDLFHVVRRNVLEAGSRLRMPCLLHRGFVFPGETVPLLLPDEEDAAQLARIVMEDGLFTLLSPNPDEQKRRLSGYGVVCEVFSATRAASVEVGGGQAPQPVRDGSSSARALARALHRCKLLDAQHTQHGSGLPEGLVRYSRLRVGEVEVLPDLLISSPLHASRLASLDQRRPLAAKPERWVRALDAMLTPWPLFVYDYIDLERMRNTIKEYFRSLGLESRLPQEPVELSFWVARNMSLSERDRSALFTVDNVILRLQLECSFISRTAVVCCGACRLALAQRAHVMCMSSSGVHGTFANPHGHMHDVVTTRRAAHVRLQGEPCADFSWFPGYTWTVLCCARCLHHVGWRFDAISQSLRPRRFYGLCRNYEPSDTPPPGMRDDDAEEMLLRGLEVEEMPPWLDAEEMPREFDAEEMPSGLDAEVMPRGLDAEEMPREFDAEEMPSGLDAEEMPREFDAEEMPSGLDAEEMPRGLDAEEMPRGLDAEEIPRGLDAEEMPRGLDAEEMPRGLDAEEMPRGLDAEEMPRGLDAEEMPRGLDAEEMPRGLDAEEMPSGLDAEEMPRGLDAEEMPREFDAEEMPSGLDAEEMPRGLDAEEMPRGLDAEEMQRGLDAEEMPRLLDADPNQPV